MNIFRQTSQFKRDVRRMVKRGKDFSGFKEVLQRLGAGEGLAAHYRDQLLVGQYKGTRECHVEPDWLLIYESTENEIVLIRTGSHAELFE